MSAMMWLSCLIDDAVSRGDTAGYRCCSTGPFISHLFFADDTLLFACAYSKDCKSIKRILGDYALASGQVVNFRKSALCINKSVPMRVGVRLAHIVGVNLVSCHDMYLGFPGFAGRNKRQLFDSLKDRVWCKINGWRHKIFSARGKEVLLKAVIQAIPSYAMNLFRLPKGFMSEIQLMCSCFWWGSTDSVRKMH
ncbi:hypothetical protein Dsin_028846 [Dipteronia sinensis]|uniref:Reverse transcriptase n=1 Tax=Dipteronia sinensis TaxID=43782 RepID=A0AAD9ZRC3_9ROSI|nr:hypothetical protein Dsin_028846 [Dipteronia sinensis]